MKLEFQDEDNNEIISSNNQNTLQSVDGLLPIDEDRIKPTESEDELVENEDDEEGEEPAKVQTKHNFVTSPWSRLGVAGGGLGIGFIAMYALISPMMGGGNVQTAKNPEPTPTPTSTPFADDNNGELQAKLALQKQQTDLQSLNGKEEDTKTNAEEETPNDKKQPSEKATPTNKNTTPAKTPASTQTRVTPQQAPPPPRRSVYREPSPEPVRPRRSAILASRIEPARAMATLPRVTLPTNTATLARPVAIPSTPRDPLADIERLRNIGNIGRVEYGSTGSSSNLVASNQVEESSSEESPRRSRRNRRNSETIIDAATTNTQQIQQPNNTGEPEELRPRWEPVSYNTVEFTASDKQLENENFLAEEAQILEEKQAQYLVVGSSTKATLVTPLILTQGATNSNLRFVARLDEPVLSNTGAVAIPSGAQVAVAINSVDAGFNIYAEVTAILKDGTEYPVPNGAISILGKGNTPLIARPFKDKGGEVARYDTTLAAVAGIAKVGEIINQPDSSTTQNLPLGGTVTSTTGNNRNLTGAFLEGAFGALGQSISSRTQAANAEIAARPNVWYVPANTKVSILINRSIKLP
ncbi:unknown protein [Rivularia sp. IAM M-261]|nr:unknown protein [Rivularia sp. IAM M-261]